MKIKQSANRDSQALPAGQKIYREMKYAVRPINDRTLAADSDFNNHSSLAAAESGVGKMKV
ncbi:hypothetical protein P4282_00570 [Bacillus swezeyi]|uniref:hypothetical protein n=1 Tax=Bacillus swezeyi TaxID=1925020 RepID=UPI0027DB9944|nr:hypothetical protein [Bacillus swezeyi]MED1739896.1 hypothetical protein [Bacillus swezeyi]MED2940993.1 hypothetical protein [Bacillus swezeyi]